MSNWFERVRGCIVAHCRMNTRGDTEYRRANAHNDRISDQLRHLLDVWFRRGDIAVELDRQKAGTHFGVMSWHCLLAGYGSFPAPAPNQPGNHKGDRYHELGIHDFLSRCAVNFGPLAACLAAPPGAAS